MPASPAPAALPDLLEVEGLTIAFPVDGRWAPVVNGASFTVRRGECVGLVGESGSGKSMTALALLRLVPPPGRVSGRVRLAGEELLSLPAPAMRRVRGGRIGLVFQEPASALDPVYTIGFQIAEAIRAHRDLSRRAARREAEALLARVAMPDPRRRLDDYPHQLSGGQRQRAMLAVALAAGPELLIADEPTTALDVTLQAAVLELLADLRRELGLAVLLITHDLGVVAEACDRAVVMYAGEVVEAAPVGALFGAPAHPYTRALLAAIPVPPGLRRQAPEGSGGRRRLAVIPGQPPEPGERPPGCAFAPRCPEVFGRCAAERPRLERPDAADSPQGERAARCFLAFAGGTGDAGARGTVGDRGAIGARGAIPAGHRAPAGEPAA
jgi:oligopeptide/dipeptide ABC transporter ATP-binding protein